MQGTVGTEKAYLIRKIEASAVFSGNEKPLSGRAGPLCFRVGRFMLRRMHTELCAVFFRRQSRLLFNESIEIGARGEIHLYSNFLQ